MEYKRVWKLICVTALFSSVSIAALAESIPDPCAGATPLLNIIDRPTAADSACAVPYKRAMLETGYEYQSLRHSAGHQQNFPEAEFRLGLPANNEFALLIPNYIHESMAPRSGFTAPTLGLKHEIGYTQQWLGSVEALFTLPSGSATFGSHRLGATFNGLVSYNYNPKINIALMFGVSTQSQSSHDGGKRFTSVNPDLVFTYAPVDKLNLYGEIYGQSKTAPGKGSGFNFDGGIIYLLSPQVAIDLEAGQRISGNLGGFLHYIGTGLALLY